MNILNIKSICIVLSVLFLSNFVFAEIVVLKDGTQYKGNIPHQDDNVVYIIQGSDLIKLKREDIKEIKADEQANKNMIDKLDLDDTKKTVINKTNEVVVKLGYDWNGEYSINTAKESSPNGMDLNVEYYHYIKNIIGVGCGIGTSNSRSVGWIPGELFIVPAYCSVKLRSIPTAPYKYGYVIGQIGYNFLCADNAFSKYEGGLYYACGFGLVLNHFVIELIYSCNNGRIGEDSNFDFKYSKYTVSVGYAF